MEVLFFLFKVIVRLLYLYLFVYILQFISHLIGKLLVYDLILSLTQSKLRVNVIYTMCTLAATWNGAAMS